MVRRDEAHAAHVGGERIHLVDVARRLQTVVPPPQIEDFELVCVDIGEFRILEIDSAYPVSALFQIRDKMMTDEATSPCNENTFHVPSTPQTSDVSWPSANVPLPRDQEQCWLPLTPDGLVSAVSAKRKRLSELSLTTASPSTL